MGKAKVRVAIESREDCIPDFVCVAVCPEVFERHGDGRARVKGGLDAGVFDASLEACALEAASLCPRGIIKVYRVDGDG
ncbi:ferredoxin [Aeropyrum camini]|uniref:Ferredoxin n=1 Tax=Aeropyrum camini SY1 = JCM 12091 TaxID=1198449 RepID=U3TDW3_9CREN|nr:ferredoxin [Aeropyrum camini]BAN89549.1 ferredoxin [Aeropyrum camini SY1 = JCM 12091]